MARPSRTSRSVLLRPMAVAALAGALAFVAVACSSDGASDEEEAAQVSLAEGATSIVSSTTTTVVEQTTTTLPSATGLPDQTDAVQKLYDAWFADDRVTAATVADQTAIDGIWLAARGDYSLYSACSTGEFDTSGCLYRGAPGTIQFTLEKRGDNWVVIEAFYSDPSSGG